MAAILAAGATANVGVAWVCARWEHSIDELSRGFGRQEEVGAVLTVASVPPEARAHLDDLLKRGDPPPKAAEVRAWQDAAAGTASASKSSAGGSSSSSLVPTPTANEFLASTAPASAGPLAASRVPTGLEMQARSTLARTRTDYSRWLERPYMGHSNTYSVLRFGLPFRSMQYVEKSYYSSTNVPGVFIWREPGVRGGWPIAPDEFRQSQMTYVYPRHVYPLTPLPGGTLANTAIYAAGIGMGVLAWRWVRGRRRRRADLCPRCAYPVGVSPVCTECGASVLK